MSEKLTGHFWYSEKCDQRKRAMAHAGLSRYNDNRAKLTDGRIVRYSIMADRPDAYQDWKDDDLVYLGEGEWHSVGPEAFGEHMKLNMTTAEHVAYCLKSIAFLEERIALEKMEWPEEITV